jgi:hypothetical protein
MVEYSYYIGTTYDKVKTTTALYRITRLEVNATLKSHHILLTPQIITTKPRLIHSPNENSGVLKFSDFDDTKFEIPELSDGQYIVIYEQDENNPNNFPVELHNIDFALLNGKKVTKVDSQTSVSLVLNHNDQLVVGSCFLAIFESGNNHSTGFEVPIIKEQLDVVEQDPMEIDDHAVATTSDLEQSVENPETINTDPIFEDVVMTDTPETNTATTNETNVIEDPNVPDNIIPADNNTVMTESISTPETLIESNNNPVESSANPTTDETNINPIDSVVNTVILEESNNNPADSSTNPTTLDETNNNPVESIVNPVTLEESSINPVEVIISSATLDGSGVNPVESSADAVTLDESSVNPIEPSDNPLILVQPSNNPEHHNIENQTLENDSIETSDNVTEKTSVGQVHLEQQFSSNRDTDQLIDNNTSKPVDEVSQLIDNTGESNDNMDTAGDSNPSNAVTDESNNNTDSEKSQPVINVSNTETTKRPRETNIDNTPMHNEQPQAKKQKLEHLIPTQNSSSGRLSASERKKQKLMEAELRNQKLLEQIKTQTPVLAKDTSQVNQSKPNSSIANKLKSMRNYCNAKITKTITNTVQPDATPIHPKPKPSTKTIDISKPIALYEDWGKKYMNGANFQEYVKQHKPIPIPSTMMCSTSQYVKHLSQETSNFTNITVDIEEQNTCSENRRLGLICTTDHKNDLCTYKWSDPNHQEFPVDIVSFTQSCVYSRTILDEKQTQYGHVILQSCDPGKKVKTTETKCQKDKKSGKIIPGVEYYTYTSMCPRGDMNEQTFSMFLKHSVKKDEFLFPLFGSVRNNANLQQYLKKATDANNKNSMAEIFISTLRLGFDSEKSQGLYVVSKPIINNETYDDIPVSHAAFLYHSCDPSAYIRPILVNVCIHNGDKVVIENKKLMMLGLFSTDNHKEGTMITVDYRNHCAYHPEHLAPMKKTDCVCECKNCVKKFSTMCPTKDSLFPKNYDSEKLDPNHLWGVYDKNNKTTFGKYTKDFTGTGTFNVFNGKFVKLL